MDGNNNDQLKNHGHHQKRHFVTTLSKTNFPCSFWMIVMIYIAIERQNDKAK
jgi:hypothetical protein